MDLLKKKILEEGEVYEGNILKVDGFLNHRIDIPFKVLMSSRNRTQLTLAIRN